MGRRALISNSESEDEIEEKKAENRSQQLKKKNKKMQVTEEEEEEEEEEESENSESNDEDAKPIGDIVKCSGKGKGKRNHYNAFEFNGTQFELEDPVLLTPEDKHLKPYVAIIKDITQDKDGSMMVTGQWFYRPEEAEKRGGGSWEARDTRELFYSFHLDEVPAESVMHKCIVHFVPLNKKFPLRSQYPGFIVQRVYDTVERKLWKLTDKDYEDDRQHEIDLLVQKTRDRLGELPDIETEIVDTRDHLKTKQEFKRRMTVDIPREDVAATKPDHNVAADTRGNCTSECSEYHTILVKFNAIIGDSIRDKSLEKLLAAVQFVCNSKDVMQVDNGKDGSQEKGWGTLRWPDVAVPAVVSLEKAAHEALGTDHTKYTQKMRQLVFNLKNNARLATRMIKRELEGSVILNMSPNELKDGLTIEETATNEPEESKRMPMTDARCSRCTEKKAVLIDIIQAGGRGDRYQLECTGCGNIWYASRDESSAMTIDAPSVAGNVGTAPWATAKFEDVEKKLLSPRESEKSSPDIFAKKTSAYMPVLETQKSFRKNKPEDPPASTAHNAE